MSRLLSYYGDDFTGSTDVMEALASHGVSTVLFTRQPTASEFAPYADYQAFGLAGTSRSEPPSWMNIHLPVAFEWLKSLQARFCHYKVCSTFDSSPLIGNIGRAAELGASAFEQAMVPLLVGAPQLKRYTFAGNLFAAYQGEVFRIDRHPVMSRHPVTPMHEADLCRHLALQTAMPIGLAAGGLPAAGLALLDVHDSQTQVQAGESLLEWGGGFLVGSSGVEYALLSAMAKRHMIPGKAVFAPLDKVSQCIVVSGSVSPTTERQIGHATQNGFVTVAADAAALAHGDGAYVQKLIELALGVLNQGASPLVHTALGPATDDGAKLATIPDARRKIGENLGQILKVLIAASNVRRVIVAGGDSSSHALRQLDVFALTTRMPLPATPGSPLCVAASAAPGLNNIEIALKGGQVGADNYFSALRDGKS